MSKEPDEILDLVDENDNVVGTIERLEAHKQDRLNEIRAVWLFVVNSKGQLWIPRRAHDKPLFPGCLDGSVTGHVSSGESYDEAIVRETLEELNIDLTKTNYRKLAHMNPFKEGTRAFVTIYELVMDEAPDYAPGEFCEASWMWPDELLRKIDAGEHVKSSLPVFIKKLYGGYSRFKGEKTSQEDEIIDVVDEDGKVVKSVPRSEVMGPGFASFRIVLAVIKCNDGTCFFGKSSEKKRWPGAWALVGGCIKSGEEPEVAMRRELEEEAGLGPETPLKFIGYFNPKRDKVLPHIYAYEASVTDRAAVTPDEHEFGGFEWLSIEAITAKLSAGELSMPSLPVLLRKFYMRP